MLVIWPVKLISLGQFNDDTESCGVVRSSSSFMTKLLVVECRQLRVVNISSFKTEVKTFSVALHTQTVSLPVSVV